MALPSEKVAGPDAGVATCWGVSLVRDERGLRVSVPPVPSWRQLHRGFLIGGAGLASAIAMILCTAIVQRDPNALPALAQFAIALLAVVWVAFHRLHRRIIFQVTPDELVITTVAPLLSTTEHRWTRASVTQIKRNPTNDKLLIRVSGQEMVELYISPGPALAEWLAQTLTNELQSVTDGPHVRHMSDVRTMSSRARKLLLGVACSLAGGGLLMLFLGSIWTPLAFVVFLLASLPAGIALGTQEKDYYFF